MSKEIMALKKYAGNEIILPYPGDKRVFLQQIGNAVILKAQKFERPDILVPLDSKILAVEHFEFDASVVDKKGSSEKREESFLGKQFDKKIAELSPEQPLITSTNSYICRYSKEDYIKNFKSNFTSHYEKVGEYKKHIVDEGLVKNNEEIGMAFFIVDATALGSFYEKEGETMNTEKFTGKAQAYAKARPGYPEEAIEYICSLVPPNPVFADVGAGTGKFTELLAARGYTAFAVEPTGDMREQLAITLAPFLNAKVVNGTAEATTLPDHSVDIITCAQALGWFDLNAFRTECRRIGKPGAIVVSIYNDTQGNSSDSKVGHLTSKQASNEFFKNPAVREFPNPIIYTREKWIAYRSSHSYSPLQSDLSYDAYIAEMNAVFDRENVDGLLRIDIASGVLRGYLAFADGVSIGWCNVNDKANFPEESGNGARFHAPAENREKVVACFEIAPDFRGKGVATALLQRVIDDAKNEGYLAVEGYPHKRDERYEWDFTGPMRLYERAGFVEVGRQGDRVVMRRWPDGGKNT